MSENDWGHALKKWRPQYATDAVIICNVCPADLSVITSALTQLRVPHWEKDGNLIMESPQIAAELAGPLFHPHVIHPFVWELSERQARALYNRIVPKTFFRWVEEDALQRLALHAGLVLHARRVVSSAATKGPGWAEVKYDRHYVRELIAPYTGAVHCLTVPTGVFMVRRDGIPVWTGNSIVAKMLQQSDMPFTESGLVPTIIINTHSQPSRMTVGQLIETNISKICARKGVLYDGTPFLPVDHGAIRIEMLALGFRYNGRERMYNGLTGEHFDAAIFIGPTMEQRLQKFVLDDEQSVAGSGPTDATTGQPLRGKHVKGGLRIGHMERDTLDSHGSMINLAEKLGTDSDGRTAYICRGCANYATYNEFHNIYKCRVCGDQADIAAVDSSKSAILFHEELAAGSINLRMGLRPREFEEQRAPPAYAADAD
jgi:uncharacterized CHY-type Zn-finger protein